MENMIFEMKEEGGNKYILQGEKTAAGDPITMSGYRFAKKPGFFGTTYFLSAGYDFRSSTEDVEKEDAIHRCIHSICHLIQDHAEALNIPLRFAATKLAEGDSLVEEALHLDQNAKDTILHIVEEMEQDTTINNYVESYTSKPDKFESIDFYSAIGTNVR